jgi:hypothetical protein
MVLIYDLKITSTFTSNIGFIKDSIDPYSLIEKKKVEEIKEISDYEEYFLNNKRMIPPLDQNIFKYFKCYSGSYIQIYDNNEYSIVITFFIIKNPELITERIIENNKIRQIFVMSTLIVNNMINPVYHQYRQYKFIKDIDNDKILDLSFDQPDYIKTTLWTTQRNNISWLIKNYLSENKIRFSNNIYIKFPNDLILDYTASTKIDSSTNKFIELTDIPEQHIKGIIICDDPGMGKTLQIITFSCYMYYNHNVKTLIVYPDHLEGHWQKQAQMHIMEKINYKSFIRFLSFTKFSNIIRFEEINDNEILVFDEYHETYDSKKNYNYKVYENSIRFPFKFKVALTSTPFITSDSLLKIIQYLCGKTFHNTTIAYNPEIQDQFVKYFKRNLIQNNTKEIKIPEANIIDIEIEFNRYEKDIYDSITNNNKNKTLINQLELCCDVYLMFESNVNSMKTPKDLKIETLIFFETKYYNDFYYLEELNKQMENINKNKNQFKNENEYLQRLSHFENQIKLKSEQTNLSKATFERYKSAIDKIEKIIKNDEVIDGDDVCAICLSEHVDPIAFFKKCGHYFCKVCVEHLKMQEIRCPICRNQTLPHDILYVTNTAETTLGSKFVQLIKQLKESDESFIIFTQFKKLIQNIKTALDKYSISNITFTELFKSKFTKKAKVVIMSSDENASGIDELTFISNMIIFEPFLDYSYGKQIEKQLVGRIRRIGQKQNRVNVYRYYIKDTIEQTIYL